MLECKCGEKFGSERLFEMHVEDEHESVDYNDYVEQVVAANV